jgi:TnpA family transposase
LIKPITEEWEKIKQIIATLANKELTQSNLIKKLCKYRQTRTLKAIFEFEKLIRSIYTLRYLRDFQLQKDIHRSQNRIESYHQLRATIAKVTGKKQIIGKTDIGYFCPTPRKGALQYMVFNISCFHLQLA